ncbi:hypothetical protein PsYK624_076040 [Phanerochaete sordida]|uniref:Uncharacterized protein n=1 Tax=Phanerochaete sordida TaxID=48140 RepID=A0A9P3GBR8_9APHY|nr:hypothetical protein PsYK624_076040 [Phanerochaete sordida]
MSRKATQSKPPPSWPAPPSLTPRPLSSTPERAGSRRASNPPMSPMSVDSFKSAEASPILSERGLTPTTRTPAAAKDSTASSALALIGPVSSPTTPRNTAQHETPETPAAVGGGTEDATEPVLPMTPKSPDARSPATNVAPLDTEFEHDPPATDAVVSKDLGVVDELLGTMRQMLETLGATADTLGEQTIKVATLPAAMAAVQQIASAKEELDLHQRQQEENMLAFKQLLLDEVRSRLYARLKDTASAIVKEVIQKEIAERVRKQLREQIPQSMRDEVLRYKHQIMEVQVSLHNSEARRHNALIRSNSLDEPLRPLLRPPPSLDDIFPRDASSSDGRPTPQAVGSPDPASALPVSPGARRRKSLGNVQGRRARLSVLDLDTPTASPLFPRDLAALARLDGSTTRELMRDYGLVKTRRVPRQVLRRRVPDDPFLDYAPPSPQEPLAEEGVVELVEEDEAREETLNRFLQFIGVTFRVVPTAGTPTRAKGFIANSPLRPR